LMYLFHGVMWALYPYANRIKNTSHLVEDCNCMRLGLHLFLEMGL
jgi:hypothetical protein